MPDELLPLERRLDILTSVFERAQKYGTGLIIFVIYRAESSRATVESQLVAKLKAIGQRVRWEQFRPDDPPEAADLMGRLQAKPPAVDEVVFVYGLRHALPKGLLNSLNYRRELVPEGRWHLLFWAREAEVTRIMRGAPDFWAFVNQTINLPEIPEPEYQLRLAENLAWTGFDDTEIRQLSEEELRARIALRERLLNELPDDETTRAARADLNYTLGGLYRFFNRFRLAEKHLQIALELARQEGDKDQQTGILNGLGNVYRAMGDYEAAKGAYEQAVELDPTYAKPYNGLGNVYDDLGDYEAAKGAYEQALKLDPKLALPHAGLGNVYRDLGQYEEALAAYERAIELDPKNAYLYNRLGNAYRILEQYEEAIAAYEKAIELDPKLAYPYNGLGNVYRDLEQYEEAIAAYQKSVELQPRAMPYTGLGNAYYALGQYEEAIAAYQQAIERDPNYVTAIFSRGLTYIELNLYSHALEDFNRAVSIDETVSKFSNRQGLVLSYLERYAEAIESYNRALKQSPDNYAAIYNIAVVMARWKGISKAQPYFNTARTALEGVMDTNRGSALYGFGGLAALEKHYDQALDYLEEAISLQDGAIGWARHDIAWLDLRDNPRFAALVFATEPASL